MFGDKVAVATREVRVDQSTSPDLGLKFSAFRGENSTRANTKLENLEAPNFDPLYRRYAEIHEAATAL